jgi:hypothetical protein
MNKKCTSVTGRVGKLKNCRITRKNKGKNIELLSDIPRSKFRIGELCWNMDTDFLDRHVQPHKKEAWLQELA